MRSMVSEKNDEYIRHVGFLSIEKSNLYSCCSTLVYSCVNEGIFFLVESMQTSEMGQHECLFHRCPTQIAVQFPKNRRRIFYTFVQVFIFSK